MATSMDQLSAAQMKSVVQNFMDENVPCQVEYKVILTRNETGPPSRALEDGIYIVCDLERKSGFSQRVLEKVIPEKPSTCNSRHQWMPSGQPCCYVLGNKCGDLWNLTIGGNENRRYRLFYVRNIMHLHARLRKKEKAKEEFTKKILAENDDCLSGQHVRSIFRSILDEKSPCELAYKVVQTTRKVGPQDLAFEEGLYILCDTQRSGFPRHVLDHVMTDVPTNSCKWKIGGRGVMVDGDLKRRRCYSRQSCSDKAGDMRGTLWTMMVGGAETLQYRLFQVKAFAPRVASGKGEEFNGCRVCGRKDDWDSLMECSFCWSEHCHAKCAGFPAVPQGDWFCSDACMEQNRMLQKIKEEANPKSLADENKSYVDAESDGEREASYCDSTRRVVEHALQSPAATSIGSHSDHLEGMTQGAKSANVIGRPPHQMLDDTTTPSPTVMHPNQLMAIRQKRQMTTDETLLHLSGGHASTAGGPAGARSIKRPPLGLPILDDHVPRPSQYHRQMEPVLNSTVEKTGTMRGQREALTEWLQQQQIHGHLTQEALAERSELTKQLTMQTQQQVRPNRMEISIESMPVTNDLQANHFDEDQIGACRQAEYARCEQNTGASKENVSALPEREYMVNIPVFEARAGSLYRPAENPVPTSRRVAWNSEKETSVTEKPPATESSLGSVENHFPCWGNSWWEVDPIPKAMAEIKSPAKRLTGAQSNKRSRMSERSNRMEPLSERKTEPTVQRDVIGLGIMHPLELERYTAESRQCHELKKRNVNGEVLPPTPPLASQLENVGSFSRPIDVDADDLDADTVPKVYYALQRCEMTFDRSKAVGFIVVDSRNATFADLYAMIQDYPKLRKEWDFYLPSLGLVNERHSHWSSSVFECLSGLGEESMVGDGTVHFPFRLGITSRV